MTPFVYRCILYTYKNTQAEPCEKEQMNNFAKVGAELKLGLVEMQLYAFFLEYNFADRHNDRLLQQALQVKYTREIARILGFDVPESYGMMETNTEYGEVAMDSLASLPRPEAEVL